MVDFNVIVTMTVSLKMTEKREHKSNMGSIKRMGSNKEMGRSNRMESDSRIGDSRRAGIIGLTKATLILAVAACAMLAGCGKSTKELDDYYESMNSFTTEVTAIKDNMESIDTDSENATMELLGYLDQLEEQFGVLAGLEVPKEFAGNEELSDEAYSYMQEANRLYHEFYDDPESDRAIFDAANENYSRAMKRVGYISSILKGETPEGDGVDVTEEDMSDFDPVTDDAEEVE